MGIVFDARFLDLVGKYKAMRKIQNYMNDGANYQAQAVLCFLRNTVINSSWDEDIKDYRAVIEVARWENCREQGYVISMRNNNHSRQLNIIWFEHRNSDAICAVKWEQTTLNSPTIATAEFGEIYKDKYDVSISTPFGEVKKMADWIENELEEWWSKSFVQR